jgi:hypothetical protein
MMLAVPAALFTLRWAPFAPDIGLFVATPRHGPRLRAILHRKGAPSGAHRRRPLAHHLTGSNKKAGEAIPDRPHHRAAGCVVAGGCSL